MRTYLVLALFAVVCLSSCSSRQVNAAGSVEPSKNRKLAGEFTLKDANGATVKLSDYRGKVVLLNFWATWCGPCGLEVPWFVDFEQKYKSQGFAVLGVSMDEDGWPAIKPYVTDHKINYRVLLGNDSVAQLYGGLDSLPTSFIIDKEGKVAFPPHIGLIGKNEYINEIEALLGSPQQQTALPAGSGPAVLLAGPAK